MGRHIFHSWSVWVWILHHMLMLDLGHPFLDDPGFLSFAPGNGLKEVEPRVLATNHSPNVHQF